MTKLLINENPLMVLPTLAQKIGLHEAIILQQIHYWLDPRINHNFKEGKNWVYNSYSKWREQFNFLSEVTIKRTIRSLENQCLLISKNFNNSAFNKTKWYTIDYDKLAYLELEKQIISKCDYRSKPTENEGSDRWDQIDPSMGSTRSQDEIKLIPSYMYTETTTEITTDTLSLKDNHLDKGEREKNLILIWEKNIPSLGKQLTMTKPREKRLREVFRDHFASNIEKWEKFTKLIAQTDFLMGKITDFRVSLDWAIKEENIFKILEGAYRNQKDVDKNSYETLSKEKLSLLDDDSILDPKWKDFLRGAVQRYGEGDYLGWFCKMDFVSSDGETLRIKTPTKFIKDWLESQRMIGLIPIANKVFGVRGICFEVDTSKKEINENKNVPYL